MTLAARLAISSLAGSATGAALASALLAVLALPLPAHAQRANPAATYSGEFERPYGFGYGEETAPFDANTRSADGNRLIIDGRIVQGDASSLSWAGASAFSQASAGASAFSQSSAVGNQINVITQGNWNTVIVNATQTNTGDQTTVLNGAVNLDD